MPPKYWDKFYKRHQDKFFKNRHYLEKVWGCFFPQDHLSPNGKVVLEVFMLSAVSPSKMPVILQNIRGVIKQNGYVLLRDYAVGDFAQVKLQKKDRMIGEDFYVRGVGTVRILYCPSINILTLRDHIVCITRFMMEFVYMHQCSFYFSEEFLSTLFLRAGFTTVDMNTYCRRAYNCSRNVTMDRYSPRRPVLDEAGCIMHIPRLYLKERYRNFKS
ncbi:hypothetical protein TIFTF001_006406 [Ficus carica]|uniref:Uncharacterized protein n=1 Tax=Ficus carica TaxID=3494 RepID=A0AA87ZR42_FICCA|nr:hypothetical protein TIFTF001_006406 [Ficus carica]